MHFCKIQHTVTCNGDAKQSIFKSTDMQVLYFFYKKFGNFWDCDGTPFYHWSLHSFLLSPSRILCQEYVHIQAISFEAAALISVWIVLWTVLIGQDVLIQRLKIYALCVKFTLWKLFQIYCPSTLSFVCNIVHSASLKFFSGNTWHANSLWCISCTIWTIHNICIQP